MAAKDKAQHTVNFFRIMGLVVDVGTEALRDVLHSEIPPEQLSTVLVTTRNKDIIDDLLNGRPKVINDAQYQLLTKANPDAKEFDITLLVVIIRNICTTIQAPSRGWSVKPDQIRDEDHNLGDEILRMKNIRNSITAHTPSTHMPTEKFEELWGKISDIIRRIVKNTPNQTNAKLDAVNKQIAEVRDMNVDVAGERETRWLEEFRKGVLQELEDFKREVDEILRCLDIKQDDDRETWKAAVKEVTDLPSIRTTLSQWSKSLDYRKKQIQYFAFHAYIFYAKEDAEACRESVKRLKALSQVPELKIALYEDLPLEDLTMEERMEYILENCQLLLFYVTPSLKADTLKKFETEMCLTAVIKEQSYRVIPLWTKQKKDIVDIPKALDVLLGLQLWMLNGNEDEQKIVVTKFDDTIKFGR